MAGYVNPRILKREITVLELEQAGITRPLTEKGLRDLGNEAFAAEIAFLKRYGIQSETEADYDIRLRSYTFVLRWFTVLFEDTIEVAVTEKMETADTTDQALRRVRLD